MGRAGYHVVLHARSNLAGLQAVARELQSTFPKIPGRVLCLTGDIASPSTCRGLVHAAFAWQGRVAAWINNAGADVLTGVARHGSFDEKLQRLFDVDVSGTIRLSREVAQRMDAALPQATAPMIINLGWDQASLGMEGEAGQLFGTTKAAVAAFTTSLALSYPSLRVNCVAPGWIRTEWGKTSAADYWSQRAQSESLAGRWGTAADVACTVAWLASPAAQFINGQTIAVNGGRRFYPMVHP